MVAETLREQANHVVERLGTVGITVPSNSRFAAYRDLFCDPSDGLIGEDHPRFAEAQEGFMDVQIMRFILEWTPEEPPDAWLSKLRTTVGDPSALDPNHPTTSAGRNTQFELFVAAIMRKADAFLRLGEPDVIAGSTIGNFGIACKRLTSPNKLETRVRQAREQVTAAGIPGVIALDLSVALNRDREAIRSNVSENRTRELLSAAIHGFLDEYLDRIKEWVDTTWVRGLCIEYHVPHCQGPGKWHFWSHSIGIPLSIRNMRRRREFDALWELFEKGRPTETEPIAVAKPLDRQSASEFFNRARRSRWR